MRIWEAVRIVLRGVGQVIFQNNALSGAIMLAGLFCNSCAAGFMALGAAIISPLTACLLGFDRVAIRSGLYGFNGTLIGIALVCFLPSWPLALLCLVPAAAFSTLLTNWFGRQTLLPTLTSPFVVTTWLLLLAKSFFFDSPSPSVKVASEPVHLLQALSLSYGQIMLQGQSIVTGGLFLLAIVVNSWRMALQSLLASFVSLLVILIPLESLTSVNSGLYGYNAILAFLAVASVVKARRGVYFFAMLALLLSLAIQYLGLRLGLPTLTAPFVLSVWMVMLVDRALPKRKSRLVKKRLPLRFQVG